ncbi:small rubber particle protein [Lactuca sativa]|uniref:Small rubber particle protein n=1 Tax=Lactuca sativa TaxID=4236 RepID=A0A9R1UJI6_LACSA|nr:small rubber particle protein [Lactuca sativa]KAJ0188063.1 hypothetical protein LSAT_V11C900491320 [Lactuca sativa]
MVDASSVTDEPEVQSEQEKLKHLEFVEVALVQAILYASKAYDFAKDKTGPLKPGVETLETHVKTVVGPAYEKLQDYPVVALKFVDRKVDESVTQIDGVMPPYVKGLTTTTKGLLVKVDPVAEGYASSAWKTLNYLPFVTTVAKAIAPSATLITEKYNQTAQQTSSFLPLVPTEKISRVFAIPSDTKPEEPVEEVPRGEEEVAEEVVAAGEEVAEPAAAGDEEVVEA